MPLDPLREPARPLSPDAERFRRNLHAAIMARWPDDSQGRAAKRLKIQQRALGRYLNGEVVPTLELAGHLARECGLELWQLLAPTFDPSPRPRKTASLVSSES